ncbi:MAG: TetR/AcrR family transcriptional regulator [Bacillota bacterium]
MAEKSRGSGKQEAILEAALELFAEQGFRGNNVPEIARRAGVSVGTLYHCFASKEAIVNTLYRKLKREVREALQDSFPVNAAPTDIFRVFWHRMVGYATAHPLAFAFLELHHHLPYLDEESRAMLAKSTETDRLLFQQGRKACTLKPLPDSVLAALIGGALRDLIQSARRGEIDLTAEVVDQAAACCWDAVRHPSYPHEMKGTNAMSQFSLGG